MINYVEKYKNLYDSVKDLPVKTLKVFPGEQRCSSIYPSFDSSNISLFLLSQRIAKGGFIESFCLSEEDVEKIRLIRKKINDNPLWKENVIQVLEQDTQIPYSKFIELPLGLQQQIINRKISNGKKNFQQELNSIFEDNYEEDVQKIKKLEN